MTPTPVHPCLRCGACCAAYRVAFHWSEAAPGLDGLTPPQLVQPLDPHRVVMRGTLSKPVRCIALTGDVGSDARCGIYPQRPSPCRALHAAWEQGEPSPQCDRAREAHGLPALLPDSWPAQAACVEGQD